MTNKNITARRVAITSTVVACALLLAACTGHKKSATQSAARVDGTEITVSQINYRLQRERGLRADQMDEASRKVLEQLIDEQLIVDRAEKVKMDQQPEAQQALLAARREVLARAYVEQAVSNVPTPSDQALHAYYDSNEALFANRHVYTLKEYLARVPEDQVPALRALVDAGKSPEDIEAWFKQHDYPFRGQQSTHAAEQVPLNALKSLAATPEGHALVISAGNQVHVTYVISAVSQPVTFDRAKPAIAQFLGSDARRKATEANMAALKTSGTISYAPQYAALAASAPALGTLKDVDAASAAPAPSGTRVTLPADTASGVQVTLPAASDSAGVRVTLPATNTPGVRVSLPTAPASGVEVRLPAQPGTDANKK